MVRQKTILIVEDDFNLSRLIKLHLKDKGNYVIIAHNGIEALERLNVITPDLIILDVNMPEMNGIEFYNHILTEHGRVKYPVLITTSRQNFEKTFKDIDASGFIPKPFEIKDLISEIERIIAEHSEPSVFLVDSLDHPYVNEMIRLLQQEGYKVINIPDYKNLQKGTSFPEPKYILIEYMQRDITGEELIKQIKENPQYKDVPLIVYSFGGFKEYEEKCLNAGAKKYIARPKDCEEIITAIREIEVEGK